MPSTAALCSAFLRPYRKSTNSCCSTGLLSCCNWQCRNRDTGLSFCNSHAQLLCRGFLRTLCCPIMQAKSARCTRGSASAKPLSMLEHTLNLDVCITDNKTEGRRRRCRAALLMTAQGLHSSHVSAQCSVVHNFGLETILDFAHCQEITGS